MKVAEISGGAIAKWSPVCGESCVYAAAESSSLFLRKLSFLNPSVTWCDLHTHTFRSRIECVDWSGKNTREMGIVVTGHDDGSIGVVAGAVREEFQCSKGRVSHVSCSQEESVLSVSEREICMWDLCNMKGTKVVAPTHRVTGVAWHRSPKLPNIFGFCDAKGAVTIWDVRGRCSTHMFSDAKCQRKLTDLAFAPNNNMTLATCSNAICVWDLRNVKAPVMKIDCDTEVCCLEWPAVDDPVLLNVNEKGQVNVWNSETGESWNTFGEDVKSISWSPFIYGALLAATGSCTALYSLADPLFGSSTRHSVEHHHKGCGVNVTFDGQIVQFWGNEIKTCEHSEDVDDLDDFLSFVAAMEQNRLAEFVDEKVFSCDESEKDLWEFTQTAMDESRLAESILKKFNCFETKTADELLPRRNDLRQRTNSGQQNLDEDPLAAIMISGNLTGAIDMAFRQGRYADALVIASCGGDQCFTQAQQRYLRCVETPLTRLASCISTGNIDYLVRFADVKHWKDLFSIILNFGGDSSERLFSELGQRLVAASDFRAALPCFVMSKQFNLVQRCLFELPDIEQSHSTRLHILEMICAISGADAGLAIRDLIHSVVEPIVQGGHHSTALRFLDALPNISDIPTLHAAISGDPLPPPSQPTADAPITPPISPQHRDLVQSISSLVGTLECHSLESQKALADAKTKLASVYESLHTNALDVAFLSAFSAFIAALRHGDLASAAQTRKSITASHPPGTHDLILFMSYIENAKKLSRSLYNEKGSHPAEADPAPGPPRCDAGHKGRQ